MIITFSMLSNRTCQNPNTKATALLILAKLSAANPEYILHNSIPIFTFMGTHFLKIDAKHSFDVACQAIDVIIPHIQSVCMVSPLRLISTGIPIELFTAGQEFFQRDLEIG